jgi:hypothetical protein
LSLGVGAIALGTGVPEPVPAQPIAKDPPSFAELEAARARIGEIRVRTADVFDTTDPREELAFYRWANALHVQTRVSVRTSSRPILSYSA